jgi:long-chain acyl-CoA synthetase
MLSHRALLANHDQLAALPSPPAGPDDVLLLALPLFHAYGLNSGLVAAAYHARPGCSSSGSTRPTRWASSPGTASPWWPGCRRCTSPGRSWASGSRPAFKSVRLDRCPAPLRSTRRPPTGSPAASGQPVHEGYGLTETAPVVSSTIASATRKPGSIGRPIPGVEVKLSLVDGEIVHRRAAR